MGIVSRHLLLETSNIQIGKIPISLFVVKIVPAKKSGIFDFNVGKNPDIFPRVIDSA